MCVQEYIVYAVWLSLRLEYGGSVFFGKWVSCWIKKLKDVKILLKRYKVIFDVHYVLGMASSDIWIFIQSGKQN